MNCGYIALIGCPNVGKSTLMNHLLGQKISITSRKPQTTRHQILGIKTTDLGQAIFVDTPGMHDGEQRALNRYLNRTADTSLLGVDLVIWLIDSLEWQAYDDVIVKKLKRAGVPVILAVNKVDRIKDKRAMLPFFSEAGKKFPFAEIIPVSALKGNNLEQLERLIMARLPESAWIYPEDQITDRPERFLTAEIIREKLIRRLGQELPHALTVEIERYEETPAITRIYAIVWVERDTQKNIVIGKQGALLKSIGTDARQDIEVLIDNKVYLQLWVKVKKGWANNERALNSLGFND
ncbi:MAG TPA: GTPase Era [Methylococcaceae bacterium]|jgi:GTP-binding protein Era|nr:GTPase Era [Methylococcaceae bacterium]HIN68811.1 GTPase Era [Methylococcales bacterium]HIA45857.1 GTPase Era [Methylococcaceae bacterium]HIB62592.1 GTPase Era [Methylococcaceae bacterium]HIO12883.1 GTPase Era [Methylococcales bacterium]